MRSAAVPAPRALWETLATAAIALPTLLAFNLPPSATFLNQAAALIGWGGWLVLLAAALPARLARPAASGLTALLVALALLALAALASPLWTGQPATMALSSVGLLGAAMLVALTAATAQHCGHGRTAFEAFAIGLVVAGVVSAAIGVVQVFAPDWTGGHWIASISGDGRAAGNLRQANHLSSLLLWSIVACVWLAEARTPRRAVALVASMLLLFGVVLSGSRTGMLGAVMLALWGLLDRRLSRPAHTCLLLVPLLYATFWFGMTHWAQAQQQVFGGVARLQQADISSNRFAIWSNSLALIAAHPWTGVGFGEFNFAWTLTPFPGRPREFFDHAHNLVLHFAVELGVLLAALVVGLLIWALLSAVKMARTAAGDDGPTLRAALMMVLLAALHSQLEYPLWYAYFLLPAAFAFGLCLGGPAAEAPPAAVPRSGPTPTRPLLVGAMLLMLGGAVAMVDYWRVVVIFSPSDESRPLWQRISDGRRSWFFGHHADYAAATTAQHPSDVLGAFERAPHYLLDTRLMIAWATALNETGDTERARHIAQRLREFHNPGAVEFFAPCEPIANPTDPRPFQCQAPTRALGYLDFR